MLNVNAVASPNPLSQNLQSSGKTRESLPSCWASTIHQLPFVSCTEDGVRYWPKAKHSRHGSPLVGETDLWEIGEDWAQRYISVVKQSGHRNILSRIVRDMDLSDPRAKAFLIGIEDQFA